MKKILFALSLLLGVSVAFAQDAEKMEENGVVKGSVVVNGQTVDGYIKAVKSFEIDGKDALYIWKLQGKIEFIEKSVFDNTPKIKGKMFTKYEPKKCDGFTYEDAKLGTLKFVSTKYVDASVVGFPGYDFLQVLKEYDGIKFFAWYQSATDVVVNIGGIGNAELTAKDAYSNPTVFFKRDNDERAQFIGKFNVEKEFADQPALVEKYNNKEFGTDRTDEMNVNLFGLPRAKEDSGYDKYINVLDAFVNQSK